MNRRLAFAGASVLALQAAIGLWTFTPVPSEGGDNHAYIALAHGLVERGDYASLWEPGAPPHVKYPPLFPALLALWVGPGGVTTWSALKWAPMILMLAALGFAFLWASRRRGVAFGTVLCVLVALSGGWVWATRWVLSEPLFMALVLLSFVALERGSSISAASDSGSGRAGVWNSVGIIAAGLSALTRTAGLATVAAVAGWFALKRRWGALGASLGLSGLLLLPWLLWTRGGDSAGYLDEIWRVDGFRPEAGRMGLGGLVSRVMENVGLYGTRWLPEGLAGVQGGGVPIFGTVIVLLAAVGWARRVREEVGAAEVFVPVYFGLLLLWPRAFGHFRFVVPLIPLLVFYALESVAAARPPWRARLGAVGLAAGAPLLGVALLHLAATRSLATQCAAVAEREGPYACHGPEWRAFQSAAEWSGANLPDGAVVLTGKPEIFYVIGGVPGLPHPATVDPVAYLAAAERAGARYALLDAVWPPATERARNALVERPSSFCFVRAFDEGENESPGPTYLLGIPGSDASDAETPGTSHAIAGLGVTLPGCPPSPPSARSQPGRGPEAPAGDRIPLLTPGATRAYPANTSEGMRP